VRARAERAGRPVEAVDSGFEVRDPWGAALAIVATDDALGAEA
jgi:hypothetical protein